MGGVAAPVGDRPRRSKRQGPRGEGRPPPAEAGPVAPTLTAEDDRAVLGQLVRHVAQAGTRPQHMHEQGQVHVRSAAAVRTRGLLPGAAVQAASRRCAAVHHAVAVGARGDRAGPAERDHEWAWGAAGPLRRGDPEQRGDHNGRCCPCAMRTCRPCPQSTAPPRRGHRADARVRRAVPGGMTGLALGRPRRLPWARPLPPHAGEGRLSRDSASAGRGGIQIALRRRPCGRRSSWRYLHGSHVRDGASARPLRGLQGA